MLYNYYGMLEEIQYKTISYTVHVQCTPTCTLHVLHVMYWYLMNKYLYTCSCANDNRVVACTCTKKVVVQTGRLMGRIYVHRYSTCSIRNLAANLNCSKLNHVWTTGCHNYMYTVHVYVQYTFIL